jgi:hypothetical protein
MHLYPQYENIAHIAHRNHIVDLLDAQPVQDVRHEHLKAHVLHARNQFCCTEVLVRRVAAAFAEVVDQIFGYLTQRAAFFTEVHDDANSATLGRTDALLNGKHEIWLARADVGAKHIRSVACRMR